MGYGRCLARFKQHFLGGLEEAVCGKGLGVLRGVC